MCLEGSWPFLQVLLAEIGFEDKVAEHRAARKTEAPGAPAAAASRPTAEGQAAAIVEQSWVVFSQAFVASPEVFLS